MWIEPLRENLIVLEKKEVKNTARCPVQYVLVDAGQRKYLLVTGETYIQKFYIRRSIEYQKEWQKTFNKYDFFLNMPMFVWEEGNEIRVLYPYYDDVIFVRDNKPIDYINKIYEEHAEVILCTEENINLLLDSFLEAWPAEYHKRIREFSLFKRYKNKLASHNKLKICLEHGDYTINNIVMVHNEIFLMDFEFAKKNQPIGMDKMDFKRTRDGVCRNTDYYGINKVKHDLMDEINCMIDGSEYVKTKLMDRILGQVR